MKKLLTGILIISIVCVLLSGCGQQISTQYEINGIYDPSGVVVGPINTKAAAKVISDMLAAIHKEDDTAFINCFTKDIYTNSADLGETDTAYLNNNLISLYGKDWYNKFKIGAVYYDSSSVTYTCYVLNAKDINGLTTKFDVIYELESDYNSSVDYNHIGYYVIDPLEGVRGVGTTFGINN